MTALIAEDFPVFFEAVHGHPPFPWQTRLARQVVETGVWPSLLDLPTGAGKTAAIDIGVFHLACDADRGPKRRAPLRILFVIDRRIVVDSAYDRARRIAKKLGSASDGPLKATADRLRTLAGDDAAPLVAVRLRGGVPQERDWARSPAQPLVAVSTVDQVGSRLLFRGYGVSPRMWPVHAGLVGADALWLLDEVHLSQPLEETLAAIEQGHGQNFLAERERLAPFVVVRLSATPGEESGEAFRLDSADQDDPTLRPRLVARKRARVETWEADPADAFVASALSLMGLGPEPASAHPTPRKKLKGAMAGTDRLSTKRGAVVVNRVGLARQVFDKIEHKVGDRARVLLLTGRIRPLDRDSILRALEPLFAAPNRSNPDKPIILIATQTVEAGADLDVDALVTEIAPLDSLRQRFGRLDRLGVRAESRAVILAPKAKEAWEAHERLYDEAPKNTARWLAENGEEIDFGIDGFQVMLDELVADREHIMTLLAPRAHAPMLLPAYVELWATTSPAPTATPEPALFLHGPGVSADIQMVWRADIDPNDEQAANLSLGRCPSSALEALPVPVWAAKRWLSGEPGDAEFADVPERAPKPSRTVASGRPCLRHEGERWIRAFADEVRPGDILVVPCSYGGSDAFGWNPASEAPVADLGVEAHYLQRLKGALRITRETLTNALLSDHSTDNKATPQDRTEVDDTWQRIATLVSDAGDDVNPDAFQSSLSEIDGLPDTWRRLLQGMEGRPVQIDFYDDERHEQGFVLFAKRPLGRGLLDGIDEDAGDGAEAVTGREDSFATGVRVGLIEHLGHVEAKARNFARRAGLNARMAELVALAGRMHDLGKADPRFQADLYGAGGLARLGLIEAQPLLAKSDRSEGLRSTFRAAPENFRHEALSVALAETHAAVRTLAEDERDLVLWLVGTHHGYGRPFFPPSIDPKPETEAVVDFDSERLVARASSAPLRLDQGWFERADRINRRYGPWELARLEAILRLADHAASAEEQAQGDRVKPKADAAEDIG